MKTLNISITDKKAIYSQRGGAIVCNNGDYQIKFTFDAEWDAHSEKTARFVYNGTYTDVAIQGDTATVPQMRGVTEVKVGVYAGDLCTTTAASIPCLPSVACLTDRPSTENDKSWANEAKAAAERAAEDAREEVTRLIGELGVVQTRGTSPTAVMSQQAVTENLDVLLEPFVTEGGHNLLDPANCELGTYSASAGSEFTQKTATGNSRTPNFIRLPSGASTVYISTNIDTTAWESPNRTLVLGFADDDGKCVRGQSGIKVDELPYSMAIPSNATQLHFWTMGNTPAGVLSFEGFCVSVESNVFEEYGAAKTPVRFKEDYLPESVPERLGALESAVTENLDTTLEPFETTGGHNMLDPTNTESGYYSIVDNGFSPQASSMNVRSKALIPLPTGATTIYLSTNIDTSAWESPNRQAQVLFADESGVFLSYASGYVAELPLTATIPEGATQFHFQTKGSTPSDVFASDMFCVSTESAEFEEYGAAKTPVRLKEGYLPEGVIERIAALESPVGTRVYTPSLEGFYSTDLSIRVYANSFHTDYISLEGHDRIYAVSRLAATGYALLFFDANHTALPDISIVGDGATVDKIIDMDVPAGAAYCSLSHYGTSYAFIALRGTKGTSNLFGKSLNALGDSISNSTMYTKPAWWQIIANRTGANFYDHGVSGTLIAVKSGKTNSFVERAANLETSADGVIVMGGTNDTSTPLGTWDSTDNTTFYGALNVLMTDLLKKFAGRLVIFCTPIKSAGAHAEDVPNANATLMSKEATDTVTLQLRAEAIKLKCAQYAIPCIDMYNGGGINGVDTDKVYYRPGDSLHPSAIGIQRIANKIQAELEKYFYPEQ